MNELDQSRMFLDWSPLPKRITRTASWMVEIPVIDYLNGCARAERVELSLVAFPLSGGAVFSVYRGWHEPTGTVILGPEWTTQMNGLPRQHATPGPR